MPGSLPDNTRTPGTPPSGAAATFRTPQSPARTGWVYELPRPALERELGRFGLSTSGGLQELRRRLVNLTQHIMENDVADATFDAGTPAAPASTPFIPPPAEYYYATPTLRTPVHVCETVRKWNVHFDGKTDPVAFLERVEELKASYHLTGEQLLLAIPELLRGTTLLWYRNYCDSWQQWTDFVTDFRTFFLPPDYQLHLEEDISRRKQKTGEKGRDYMVDIQTLIRRHGNMSPEQALYRIYTNILPEYRQHIRRKDIADIRALSLEIAEYEELQKNLIKASPVRLASVHAQETPKPTTRAYDPRKACWRCGQEVYRSTNQILFPVWNPGNHVPRMHVCCKTGKRFRGWSVKEGDQPKLNTNTPAFHNIISTLNADPIPDGRIFIKATIGNWTGPALIDTGAMCSYVDERLFEALRTQRA